METLKEPLMSMVALGPNITPEGLTRKKSALGIVDRRRPSMLEIFPPVTRLIDALNRCITGEGGGFIHVDVELRKAVEKVVSGTLAEILANGVVWALKGLDRRTKGAVGADLGISVVERKKG